MIDEYTAMIFSRTIKLAICQKKQYIPLRFDMYVKQMTLYYLDKTLETVS